MRARILCLLALCLVAETSHAAKKDFKGLFGSYRREKFTENEARSSDIGMDFMLSTLFPISNVATSVEPPSTTSASLFYASFFNVEANFFMTFNYHWEAFLNLSYYSYATRKQNSTTVGNAVAGTPQYQIFEMDAYPMMLGVKYRFGTTDIVPYVGAAAGIAYAHRKVYYDYTNPYFNTYDISLVAQGTAGVQFFISPRSGIKLEASAMYLGLSSITNPPGGTIPVVTYSANPIAVRYSSGLFIYF